MITQTIQRESQIKETAGALLSSQDGSKVGRGKVIDGLLDLSMPKWRLDKQVPSPSDWFSPTGYEHQHDQAERFC